MEQSVSWEADSHLTDHEISLFYATGRCDTVFVSARNWALSGSSKLILILFFHYSQVFEF